MAPLRSALLLLLVPVSALAKNLTETIELENLQDHLDAFRFIALKEGKDTRVFGSEGHKKTVEYIQNIAEEAGFDTYLQPFRTLYSEILRQILIADSKQIEVGMFSFSPSTPSWGTSGKLVNGGYGCSKSDYKSMPQWNIALLRRGKCSFSQKSKLAKELGAGGAIIFNNVDGPLRGTLDKADPDLFVPTGGISKKAGLKLLKKVKRGRYIYSRLYFQQIMEERLTHNLIAQTPQGNINNVVMLGAHSDSVRAGPGINDNGSGSSALLEILKQLSNFNITNTVRFAWWSAEEFGLQGSKYYVDSLSEEEAANIAVYMNFDMIGSPNYINGIYDGTGNEFGTAGPPGSGALQGLFEKYFEERGYSYQATEFDGRSDYGPFLGKDIASGGLFTGAEKLKTAEEVKKYGGEADVAYDKCYHKSCDREDNINTEAFLINARAIADVTSILAESTHDIDKEKKKQFQKTNEIAFDKGGSQQVFKKSKKFQGKIMWNGEWLDTI